MNSEIQELRRRYEWAANGKEKMEICRQGWELADKEESYQDQFFFREKYLSQAAFYDDAMELFVVFPVLLKKHDDYVKQYGEDPNLYRILWDYKWILENARYFYQITVEQFQRFEEDAKRRMQEAGYSLRAYYLHKSFFYAQISPEKSREAYEKFLRCRRDSLSDCHACERTMEVQLLLEQGKEEQALEKAQALFRRQLTCVEVPAITYGAFVEYFNRKMLSGEPVDEQELQEYQQELRYAIRNRKLCPEYIGTQLLSYSLTNKAQALNWFKWYCDYPETIRSPLYKFWFAIAATHFFGEMCNKSSYRMKINKNFALYREDGTYCPKELYKYYRIMATEIAVKLDKRNGNEHYMQWVRLVEVGE